MEKVRNSNIELLRIILIIFVLILHFNNESYGGIFKIAQEHDLYFVKLCSRIFESLCICAVDLFIIITGYFLYNSNTSKITKVLDLIYLSVIYSLINYLICIIIGDYNFTLKDFLYSLYPHRYFITFYIIIYIYSPFINKLLFILKEKEKLTFLTIFIFIFSLYPTIINFFGIPESGLATVSMSGNEMGYNIMTFFLCYLIGYFLRLYTVKIKSIVLLFFYLISSAIMTIFPVFWNYDSIFCILNAICLFIIFNRFTFQSKFINYVAKSVFATYILHSLDIPLKIWKIFVTDSAISSNNISYIIVSIFSILLLLITCFIIDIIQRNTLEKIKNFLLKKITFTINVE